ncbi:hypothetical protein D3C86_1400840 [compost metagenome]
MLSYCKAAESQIAIAMGHFNTGIIIERFVFGELPEVRNGFFVVRLVDVVIPDVGFYKHGFIPRKFISIALFERKYGIQGTFLKKRIIHFLVRQTTEHQCCLIKLLFFDVFCVVRIENSIVILFVEVIPVRKPGNLTFRFFFGLTMVDHFAGLFTART